MAGERVGGIAVALRDTAREREGKLVGGQRSRDVKPRVAQSVVTKPHFDPSTDPIERRHDTGDVDQATHGVAAKERALRPAHELDLIDVDQLEARAVGVELRHTVDVGRNAWVVWTGADAAEAWIAQLARGKFGNENIRREHRRVV